MGQPGSGSGCGLVGCRPPQLTEVDVAVCMCPVVPSNTIIVSNINCRVALRTPLGWLGCAVVARGLSKWRRGNRTCTRHAPIVLSWQAAWQVP